MSGNKVTELLQSRGDFVEQPPVIRGYVSGAVGASGALITAPAAFPTLGSEQNLLWVLAPEYSTTRPLGPCQWPAIHGTRLPAQFAKVVVTVDTEGVPTVVWWEGAQKEPTPAAGSITEAMLETAVREQLEHIPTGNPANFTCEMGVAVQPSSTRSSVVSVPVEFPAKGESLVQVKMAATKAAAEAATVLAAPMAFVDATGPRTVVPATFALPAGWWFQIVKSGGAAVVFSNKATYWTK